MDRPPRFDDSDFVAPSAAEEESPSATGPDALNELGQHLRELTRYVEHLISARADACRLQVRRLVVTLALVVAGLAVGLGALIAAAVLALSGLAGGLGAATGHAWLGELIVGFGALLVAVAAARWGQSRIRRASFSAATQKYEHRKHEQRREFGRDVDDAARAA